jgi:hypothetical protein
MLTPMFHTLALSHWTEEDSRRMSERLRCCDIDLPQVLAVMEYMCSPGPVGLTAHSRCTRVRVNWCAASFNDVGAMMPILHCELVTAPPNFDGNAVAIQRPLASAQKAVDPGARCSTESGFREPVVVDLIHLDFFLQEAGDATDLCLH